jgi:hypothetical protein
MQPNPNQLGAERKGVTGNHEQLWFVWYTALQGEIKTLFFTSQGPLR